MYGGNPTKISVIDPTATLHKGDLSPIDIVFFMDDIEIQTAVSGADPYDPFGHSTHVAGIIGGNALLSGGACAGVAPGAGAYSLRVLDENGRGGDF